MTIIVNSIEELEGKWINDYVQILATPYFDSILKEWCALATVNEMLVIISLTVAKLKE